MKLCARCAARRVVYSVVPLEKIDIPEDGDACEDCGVICLTRGMGETDEELRERIRSIAPLAEVEVKA